MSLGLNEAAGHTEERAAIPAQHGQSAGVDESLAVHTLCRAAVITSAYTHTCAQIHTFIGVAAEV